MKSLVLRTGLGVARTIDAKTIYWMEPTERGLKYRSAVVLAVAPPTLGEMLHEVEDQLPREDVIEAICAAASADDWHLAESMAQRYSLVICLRCGQDMQQRPGVRLVNILDIEDCWGEVCGSCAVKLS